jgi:hypothetical protein
MKAVTKIRARAGASFEVMRRGDHPVKISNVEQAIARFTGA